MSGSGISPELAKVCSGPPYHCQSLRVLCTSLGALGKAGSCGCLGRVPVVWQHRPLASSVLCPDRHLVGTPVSPSQEAQLPPELSSAMSHLQPGLWGTQFPLQHWQGDAGPAGTRQRSRLPVTGRMEICLISTSKSSSSSRGPGSPCQANVFKSNCSSFAPKFTRCFFQTLIKPFCRPPVPR